MGGQAVLEGVMLRHGDIYGLAIRTPDGEIFRRRLPWRSLIARHWLALPLVRGFPILVETLVNGIHAFNISARVSENDAPDRPWQLLVSVCLAILMAVGLFVIAPHILSILMMALGLGGDVEGLSFHIWDGFYKCSIFILYLWLISWVPEIRRVFEYHGAEHKTIHAWEKGLNRAEAPAMSRLHPRCGTTFFLFVVCISILVQAIVVPLMLKLWAPASMPAKHFYSLGIKFALIIPISGMAFELIRYAASLRPGLLADILQFPGLALQKLTTREPDAGQMEVAWAALEQAVANENGLEYCSAWDEDF